MLVQRTRYRNRGIGDVNVGSAAAIASAGATATTGILSALSAIAMGSSVAGPVGLAITGLITLGVTLAKVFAGCGKPARKPRPMSIRPSRYSSKTCKPISPLPSITLPSKPRR